ncbi:MAG: methyltransferase domain-containing protein [Candidatus Cohnella colombiensis]|uniref:Methyltransferase domain-containing protein n=1 Tax=Candidatus Cohnella colombiensis TaxID=3121368 RepID=A0AA95EWQ5_9BACL|nr:MAG: methyltransferase domain-containing protein [Cohnella sp.]
MKQRDRDQKVHWEATAYDQTMRFVSDYGLDLFKWLNPQQGESIVDFGCGTGDLASQIAGSGAEVLGVDISPEMVQRAREKYPLLRFECADGMSWTPTQTYDAVFSNAALHWMKDAEAAVETMTKCLRKGGRLVVEFGGYRNIQSIIDAMQATLENSGRMDAFVNPWYFPKVGEYAAILERHGMEVSHAMLFDRPTAQEKGEKGMLNWLHMFGTAMVPKATKAETEEWFNEVVMRLKSTQYQEGSWIADYRRIRMYALKQQ